MKVNFVHAPFYANGHITQEGAVLIVVLFVIIIDVVFIAYRYHLERKAKRKIYYLYSNHIETSDEHRQHKNNKEE